MSYSTRCVSSLQLPSLSLNLTKPQYICNCCQRNFVSTGLFVYVLLGVVFLMRLKDSLLTNYPTNEFHEVQPFLESSNFSNYSKNFPLCAAPKISSKYFETPLIVTVLIQIEVSPSYSFDIHFNIIHGQNICPLITFHLPNLMSNSHSLPCSKQSVKDLRNIL